MEQKTLHNLFLLQLKDIYSAEKQLVDALPKMIKAASNKELKTSLREHLELSKVQASRIEEIFKGYSSHPGGENSNAMEGLIEELDEMMEENDDSDVVDVSLMGGCQKIEHYEIASYGSVITYAKALGEDKAVDLLQQSLDEEYEMDNKLDKISEDIVNIYSKI
jgi:ferritin-like metal-binding protein YciE